MSNNIAISRVDVSSQQGCCGEGHYRRFCDKGFHTSSLYMGSSLASSFVEAYSQQGCCGEGRYRKFCDKGVHTVN